MTDSVEHLKHLGDCFIPVRWTDLDTYAHVNNAKHFEYLTEGRAIILQNVIKPVDDIQVFMVKAECTYLKPIDYPNNLKLKHYLKEIGRTSFIILCDMFSEDEGVHYARTECKLVCIDPPTQRPTRIPDDMREKLS